MLWQRLGCRLERERVIAGVRASSYRHEQLELGVERKWFVTATAGSPGLSASAYSNQNRMLVSRYIVVAVVRCSCAC